MVDVREVITEAIPCNVVYGRPQAADEIIHALTAAGFRIVGPEEDTAMGVVNMLLCVDFDRFTEHDQALLESVLADASALKEDGK